jgi:putative Mg2+ transporter-C (MgtC) family protein
VLGNWSDSLDHLVHLLGAFALALPIGWKPSAHGAGCRAPHFPIVAIASCGFVQTAISVLGPHLPNQANILQGIITGIGFIGAGAIIKEGTAVSRYATAASI